MVARWSPGLSFTGLISHLSLAWHFLPPGASSFFIRMQINTLRMNLNDPVHLEIYALPPANAVLCRVAPAKGPGMRAWIPRPCFHHFCFDSFVPQGQGHGGVEVLCAVYSELYLAQCRDMPGGPSKKSKSFQSEFRTSLWKTRSKFPNCFVFRTLLSGIPNFTCSFKFSADIANFLTSRSGIPNLTWIMKVPARISNFTSWYSAHAPQFSPSISYHIW